MAGGPASRDGTSIDALVGDVEGSENGWITAVGVGDQQGIGRWSLLLSINMG